MNEVIIIIIIIISQVYIHKNNFSIKHEIVYNKEARMVNSSFSKICYFSIDSHYIHRSQRDKMLFPKLLVRRQCLRPVNFDRFPLLYSDGLYCFFCHVCPHPASCKSDPT